MLECNAEKVTAADLVPLFHATNFSLLLCSNSEIARTCLTIFVFVFLFAESGFFFVKAEKNSNLRSFKEECSPLLAVVIIPSSAFVAAVDVLVVDVVGGVLLRLGNSRRQHCSRHLHLFFCFVDFLACYRSLLTHCFIDQSHALFCCCVVLLLPLFHVRFVFWKQKKKLTKGKR